MFQDPSKALHYNCSRTDRQSGEGHSSSSPSRSALIDLKRDLRRNPTIRDPHAVARRMSHATQGKFPWAALLAMTGVLPNGSLPSLVRDEYSAMKSGARCFLLVPDRIWKSRASYLKSPPILSDHRADFGTRQHAAKCWLQHWIASSAPGGVTRFATISCFAAAAHMNDRFVSNARAPLASSEMPVDLMANAIRALAMDAVQQANSGHPGMPMGMAEIAVALWGRHLSHNPANPRWINRDRFVLSNGHGSMLQYALLHLTGYDLPLQELKNFRKLHSRTPGAPGAGYDARGRNDYRAARPGICERRRDGTG